VRGVEDARCLAELEGKGLWLRLEDGKMWSRAALGYDFRKTFIFLDCDLSSNA